jgi:hypothetical protein
MATPLAVLIHFEGEPDELVERFERARRRWVEAQEDSYDAPAFYAACKRDDGIVVITAWDDAIAHRIRPGHRKSRPRRWARAAYPH